MIKCEVIGKTSLVVEKGSIVLVDDKQYELARRVLKPVDHKKAEEPKVEGEKPKRAKKQ